VTTTEHDDDLTQAMDPLVVRSRVRVGQVLLEKWRLDVLLGVGGMAAVYAATHRNGSRVAIKMLHQELSINQQVRSRFLREGYVANSVGHDGAVRVADDDVTQDGAAFLVMELLDGETLASRRERMGGTLSEDDVLSIADHLLDILVAAHARGIVHRDLKPENIFLTRAGQLKVLDFGIARLRESTSASTATRSGASMGTPHYMPPEQARGRWDEVDGRSDLWAVGATMFELLSGRMVHDGQTANEVLLAAMTNHAQPLGSVAPTIATAVCYVVDKALRFERERRWLDAGRMQEAVRHAYHDRHGKPLSSAAKLTVPENVPNRTLPQTEAQVVEPQNPTTAQPVARSKPDEAGGAPAVRPSSAWVDQLKALGVGRIALAGAAGAVGVIGIGLAVMAMRTPASGTAQTRAPAAPQSAPAEPSVQVVLPPPTATPVVAAVAATDLPKAETTTTPAPPTPAPQPARPAPAPPTPPQPARAAAPPPTPAPAPAPAKPDCSTPYTVDSTGHRHWKPQCL
jgi:serine/threonine-protein kinase